MKPRPYQSGAVSTLEVARQHYDSMLVQMATGLGKTYVVVLHSSRQPGRTLVVCPLITLLPQTASAYLKVTGEYPAIEQASQFSNESAGCRSKYIVGTKQSLCSSLNGQLRYERLRDIDTVVIDEAHGAITAPTLKMIQYFLSRGAKVIGLTATPKRHDKRAMEQAFDACVFQYGIQEGIKDGWLCEPKVLSRTIKNLDLSKVRQQGSGEDRDWSAAQLDQQMAAEKTIYEVCEAIDDPTRGLKTAVYAPGVKVAQQIAERLEDYHGIKAAWICADKKKCPDQKRHEVLRSFTRDPDGITHVVNVGILTMGWDFPGLQALVMARPTQSKTLYTQIFGRLTRCCEVDGIPVIEGHETADDRKAAMAESTKPNGLMIDLVDASVRHKITTALDVLGGVWGIPEKEEAANLLDDGEPKTIEEIQQHVAGQLERRRRLTIRSRAEFDDRAVNPFGRGAGSGRRGLSPRQVTPATDPQLRFLWVLGFKDVDRYRISKAQARRIIGQLKSGMGVAAMRQVNSLRER